MIPSLVLLAIVLSREYAVKYTPSLEVIFWNDILWNIAQVHMRGLQFVKDG